MPKKPPKPRGLGEAGEPFVSAIEDKPVWAKIGPGGRIVIPAAMRRALGVGEGDHVQLSLHDEELHVVPQAVALRRVQDLVAKYARDDGRSWVDELFEERRREVEEEEREAREGRAAREERERRGE